MKKLISLVMVLVLVCGIFVGCCVAEEQVVYKYTMLGGGAIELTGVNKTDLEVLDIPAEVDGYKVTSIDSFAFGNCDNLISVNIPEGVETVKYHTFANAFNLKSVSIPDSLVSIGGHAFRSKKLTEIKVSPDHPVFAVENEALIDKRDMTLVRFLAPELDGTYVVTPGITKIAEGAFEFARVSSILIPDSVNAFGDRAFTDCDSLKSINIPDSVVEIGNAVFDDCDSLTSIQISREHPVYDCIDQVMVKKENMEMFAASGALRGKYVIPTEIRSIASYTFQCCRYLDELYIPDTVETIGEYAFSVDTVLRAPSGSAAQKFCKRNTRYRFTEMSPEDFAEAVKELKSEKANMTQPEVIQSSWHAESGDLVSGDYHYTVNIDGTAEITSVSEFIEDGNIPAELDGHKVTSIGSFAFFSCSNLEKVVIPEGVTTLKNSAFEFCPKLESVSIPNSLERMEGQPFSYCRKLKDFAVSPDHNVYKIEDGMLINKQDMTLIHLLGDEHTGTFTVPQGIRRIAHNVFESTEYSSVILPDSLKYIGDHAFSSCNNLTEIVIPDKVTLIGLQAFFDCAKLESFTIPDNVHRIDGGAFGNCKALTSIQISEAHPYYMMIDHLLVDKRNMSVISALNDISDKIEIPEGIKEFGFLCFQGCDNLTEVVIPEGFTKIGSDAFSGCTKLRKITLPASLNEISYGAFDYSYELVIKAPAGSWAQQYAEDNGYRYETVE